MEQEITTEVMYCHNCTFYDTEKNCKHYGKKSMLGTCAFFSEKKDTPLLKKEEIRQLILQEKKAQKKVRILQIQSFMANVLHYHELQPFFYDKSNMFWIWDLENKCWHMTDEIDLMNMIEEELGFFGETIPNSIKNGYLEAFKRVGRKNKPKDIPINWVQFKDKIFDINTKQIVEATPEYFTCNPIPWKLGTSTETPIIDKLFNEWVGADKKRILYEIIAYSCLCNYPIHRMFCFMGVGRNGKSCCQNLINKFIGDENITSTELDTLLDSRFESAKLYKKLVCTIGETNFGTIKKTSLLKKLVGQDKVGFEFKGKTPFVAKNYAKIIISSNQLPITEDTGDAFYRRWCIVDFPNNFSEGQDIVNLVPDVEFENLALKITTILPEVLAQCGFSGEGSIEERQKSYDLASNPFVLFLKEWCDTSNVDYCTSHGELFMAYLRYLQLKKKRQVSNKVFSTILAQNGLDCRKTWVEDVNGSKNGYFVFGVKLRPDWRLCDACDVCDVTFTSRAT